MLNVSLEKVSLASGDNQKILLNNIQLDLSSGERIGVVGRSGSGKTMLTRVITASLDPKSFVQNGCITIADSPELQLASAAHRSFVRENISVIWQDSIRSLNPYQRISTQLVDTLRLHGAQTRRDAELEAVSWLERVSLDDPERVMQSYPHQLSGGMRQRVSIALGLCGKQPIVIADEPTTALDTLSQAECVQLLDQLCEADNRALIFISHDLALTAELCPRIMVLKNGDVVETGPSLPLLSNPSHPETNLLVSNTRSIRRLVSSHE